MNTETVIKLAAQIESAASQVCVSGPANWANMLGIMQAAAAIKSEMRKAGEENG